MGNIIGNVGDVIALVILFGVTIFVHELGHYLVARWCGMVIDVFSIGFGPPLWKKKVGDTVYKIGVIPFGGYVALPQLDPAAMSTVQGKASEDEASTAAEDAVPVRELPPISPWKKILVSLAGAAGNVVLAVIMAWVIFFAPEAETDAAIPRLGYVVEESAAYAAGLRAGDSLLAVDGEPVASWIEFATLCVLKGGNDGSVTISAQAEGDEVRELVVPVTESEMGVPVVDGLVRSSTCLAADVIEGGSAAAAGVQRGDSLLEFDGIVVEGPDHFIELVAARPGQDVMLRVQRDDELIDLKVTPAFNEVHGRALVGIQLAGMDAGPMPWMQHKEPMAQIKGDATGIARILRALVTPKESKQAAKGLGGPIMIFATLWISIQTSFLNALGFLRFLNINLAMLNLLPIPVLDGGHIVFSLWEAVTRRRVHPKVVGALVNVFAVLLIGAFLILTYRDATRLNKVFGILKRETADQVEPSGPVEPAEPVGPGAEHDDVTPVPQPQH